MCGIFGTAAGIVFLLVCPLMMIGMMAVAFLVRPRLIRGRGGQMMCRLRSDETGHDEERPIAK